MLETVHGLSILDIQTLFVQEWQELLLIILLLVNIDWDSFFRKISAICIVTILSKQDVISYMSAEDITSIGIQGETWLAILFFFWSLTVGHLLLKVPSYSSHRAWLYEFFYFSFKFCFFLFSFFFSFIM